jgi:ABC-type transport system involved in multi-copper enzyme maturation permease subunit
MLDFLRLVGALLLIFFIPGILLVQALFPRKGELDPELDWVYRLALGIGLSIVVTILVNFALNSAGVNPDTGMGYVTAIPITVCLVLLSLLFFTAAWLRGGLPIMGRLHPSLIRFPSPGMRDDDIPRIADRQQRLKHQVLMKERFGLVNEIAKCERMAEAHSGEQKSYYLDRRRAILAKLAEVEAAIKDIERGYASPKAPTDAEKADTEPEESEKND